MAGARPSQFKKVGGGFLDNVTGTIHSITWTDIPPGGEKPNAKQNEEFISLFGLLKFTPDGAEEAVTQHLWAGNALDFNISDDGFVLEPVEENGGLRGNSTFTRFIDTLVAPINDPENGFDEMLLPEDEISYAAVSGSRVTLVQEIDPTMKGKKRKDKKDPKKEYDYKRTVVANFLGMAEVKKTGKAIAGKSAPAKGKPAKTVDVAEVATEAVVRYLESAPDNTLLKGKLRLRALADGKLDDSIRTEVIDYFMENLDSLEGVNYTPKTGAVSLAA
jgi:hypothetical protein